MILNTLFDVAFGDTVFRFSGSNAAPLPLEVTAVSEGRIVRGEWHFEKRTDAEIDESLGWGPALTGGKHTHRSVSRGKQLRKAYAPPLKFPDRTKMKSSPRREVLERASLCLTARSLTTGSAENRELSDGQRRQEMRHTVRAISRQIDQLEPILRPVDMLETKQAVRSWFYDVVHALGARSGDSCKTAQGRAKVLRESAGSSTMVHS